jgi:hypothetical protein
VNSGSPSVFTPKAPIILRPSGDTTNSASAWPPCPVRVTRRTWLTGPPASPHAEQVVVAVVLESRGQKDDQRDAFALAERLRTGALKQQVFKEVGAYGMLRELGRAHAMVMQDSVRVQSRLKALYRSRGIAVAGKSVYEEKGREELLEKLPETTRAAAARTREAPRPRHPPAAPPAAGRSRARPPPNTYRRRSAASRWTHLPLGRSSRLVRHGGARPYAASKLKLSCSVGSRARALGNGSVGMPK